MFFTGGGTGGHVYPGIAVYEAVVEKAVSAGVQIKAAWIGSRRGLERDIIEPKGIRFIGIPSGKLRRYFSFSNVIDIFRVVAGIAAAYLILRRHRPGVLFSKGGYVSVPPVIAARIAGVPVVTHESDFDPGLATRINSRFARKIIVSFAETCEFFPDSLKSRLVVAGNPVRREVLAGSAERGLRHLSSDGGRPVLLVLGGSQGSREINELLWRVLPALLEDWEVVHQTGSDESGPPGGGGYRRYSYIGKEYGDVLAAADLVLCRAGATTLWELAAAGKPSILVPLGTQSSRGDQIRNAGLFESLGASYILQAGNGGEEALTTYVRRVLSEPETLIAMGKRAASVFRPDAAGKIAELLLEIANGEVGNED